MMTDIASLHDRASILKLHGLLEHWDEISDQSWLLLFIEWEAVLAGFTVKTGSASEMLNSLAAAEEGGHVQDAGSIRLVKPGGYQVEGLDAQTLAFLLRVVG